MRVSVIVLTWNGLHYLGACLESLLVQDYPDFEVVVVDNGSTDGTPDLVAERFPAVRLIRNGRNLGFAMGNNIGLRVASGDLLVLLNQDTEVHPGFLQAMADTFDDPGVGIAGCKLLYPDGAIQHAGGYLYGPRGETGHVGRLAPDDGRFDEPTEPDFVTGAALAISRAALREIGPLDEGFTPAYYEDVDWCYRARAAGFRVVYQPAAVATHHESKAASLESHRHKFALNHGRVRFLFKHLPLEKLLHEFGPAELAWVSALDRSEEVMGARRAYLHILLDLPNILAFRGNPQAEAEALVGLLTDLRAGAMSSLEALPLPEPLPEMAAPAPKLEKAILEETIRQPPPARRGLLARLRRLWAGLRYLDVLPDMATHLHQHDHTLAQQGEALARQGEALARQGEVLVQQGEALARHEAQSQAYRQLIGGLSRDVAENIRELTALAERLVRAEEASLEHPQEHPRD